MMDWLWIHFRRFARRFPVPSAVSQIRFAPTQWSPGDIEQAQPRGDRAPAGIDVHLWSPEREGDPPRVFGKRRTPPVDPARVARALEHGARMTGSFGYAGTQTGRFPKTLYYHETPFEGPQVPRRPAAPPIIEG